MDVLIVDDNAGMSGLIRDYLLILRPGISVGMCASIPEAVATIARERPKLVLIDIRMDGIDGLGGTALISRLFPGTRVVIVSQFNDLGLREEGARQGACGFVQKDRLDDLEMYLP